MSSSTTTSISSKLPLILTSAAAVTALSYFLYTRFLSSQNASTTSTTTVNTTKTQQPQQRPCQGNPRICEIWVFPIAGCRGFCLNKPNDSWNLVDGGLEFDREFCFAVPDKNDPTIMKKLNTLPIQYEIFTKIETCPSTGEKILVVSYKNAKHDLRISLNDATKVENEKIFTIERSGIPGHVVDCGDQVAIWFKEQVFADLVNAKLGIESDTLSYKNNRLSQVRLVRPAALRKPIDSKNHRGSSTVEGDRIRFQFFCTIHIVARESCEWLQSVLPKETIEATDIASSQPRNAVAAGSNSTSTTNPQPAPMLMCSERFKPTILVENIAAPCDEDLWKTCDIVHRDDAGTNTVTSTIAIHFAKHNARCEIPPMFPKTGRRHPTLEPLPTLMKYRGAKFPHQVATYEKLVKAAEEKKKNGIELSDAEQRELSAAVPTLKPMFAVDFSHTKNGVIFVGDEIVVKERNPVGFLKFEQS